MTRRKNISKQTLVLLKIMAATPNKEHYGYELMKKTGFASGTIYPILIRLTDQNILESYWGDLEKNGKPPRHVYKITAIGILEANKHSAVSTKIISKLKPHIAGGRS